MDLEGNSMHPLPTPHSTFNSPRTDDDIHAAVSSFLHNEGSRLHSQTWQDTTADVTQWLAMQIQKEREGWRQKTRGAMNEIESHRREVLRYKGLIQQCTDQMRIVAECCNMPEETLNQLSDRDPRDALPIYIESLTETLNSLMEDRITCLQILKAENHASRVSLPSLLKVYIESLKSRAEKAHREAKSRLESLESANKQSHNEMQKLKKTIYKKQEEVEQLHSKLKEIKDVTLKKFKEVSNLQKSLSKEMDDQSSQTDPPVNKQRRNSKDSLPSSLYSAPTPLPEIDQRNIQISSEKLSKLRRSAKKLESSLNDAITQMEGFKKGTKSTKITPTPTLAFTPQRQFEVPSSLKKEMKLLPSPMWSTKFEVSGPKTHDAELDAIKRLEFEEQQHKKRAKEKRLEAMQKSQEKKLTTQEAPTFRSLIKSLDEAKKNRPKTFKPVGQVTKCLRCNKLFTLNDNHKKSCNYHPKGKERIEQYSDRGKLVKVTYVWKCCKTGTDNPGCTYGQHI